MDKVAETLIYYVRSADCCFDIRVVGRGATVTIKEGLESVTMATDAAPSIYETDRGPNNAKCYFMK